MLIYPIYYNNWRTISTAYIYKTRLASNEIFSPSNKIHWEVGWAKNLSAPLYYQPSYTYNCRYYCMVDLSSILPPADCYSALVVTCSGVEISKNTLQNILFLCGKLFFPPLSLPILMNFDIFLFSVRHSTSQMRNCVVQTVSLSVAE